MPYWSRDAELEVELSRILAPLLPHLGPPTQDLCANFDPAAGDCTLHLDDGRGPMFALDQRLPAIAIIGATRLLATAAAKSLKPTAPELNCALPCGFRWHSILPPVAELSLSIRTHHHRDWRLSDFDIAPEHRARIESAIERQHTILISGQMGSGKTSLANAILALISKHLRLLIVEDEPELEIDLKGRNVTRRRATQDMDFTAHVKSALRDRADYIILGEIRGAEALDVLEAASSGHCGLSTIHGGSVDEALKRLQRLAQCDRELVREAIDLALHLERMPNGRRAVTQIKSLKEDSK